MGVIERREREREEVRRKILTAARDLFATEGYERVTMRRIADAIEYSATTIYNHFEDKDDLVHALCQEDFTRLFQHLQETPPPADPVEAVRQLGLAYARFGAGGLARTDLPELNRSLRRNINSARGYCSPIELAARRLAV